MTHEANVNHQARTTFPSTLLLNENPEPLTAYIKQQFPDLPVTVCSRYRDVGGAIGEAKPEVALAFKVGPEPFPREAFLASSTLKWVQASGAGIDHWTPWDPRQVTITNASGVHGDLMAQYTAWAILNQQLGLPDYAEQQERKEWKKVLHEPATGKTLVIVGFGNIGQEVGSLARAMGMRVIGVRQQPAPSPAADEVVGLEQLYDALAEGDYVSVILPLTEKTRNFIDAKAFRSMKRGAYFINTGRGKIVDEAALLEALQSGQLSGATMDVFATEPLPADSPFWTMNNVVVLPHATGDASDWHMRVTRLFCRNLERWLKGEPLFNVVDPARGY
jgi:phosphoglycerate dehydrogenase-like enzyme